VSSLTAHYLSVFIIILGVFLLLCLMLMLADVLAISDNRQLQRRRWRERKERR
jgi:NADH:ubiquinone oxidoreductase subunit 3 (subunit A)